MGLQWRLLDETEAVKEALEGPRVDLDRVMDRFGKALDTEMEIKRIHLELLIRIKNILTPAQQEELLRLRGDGPRVRPNESTSGAERASRVIKGVDPCLDRTREEP